MAMPKKEDPILFCKHCGKKMERRKYSNGELMSLLHFMKQKYCGMYCFRTQMKDNQVSFGNNSSARTMARRKMKDETNCESCGTQLARDVHHIDGVPQNNAPHNLMRLCRSCHMKIHKKRSLCKICPKPVKGLGYCEMHYTRFKKWGDPLIVKDNQFVSARKDTEKNKEMICKICGMPGQAKNLCGKHYMKLKRERRLGVV